MPTLAEMAANGTVHHIQGTWEGNINTTITQPTASPLAWAFHTGEDPVSPSLSKKESPLSDSNEIYNIPLITAFSRTLNKVREEGEVGLEIECEGKNLFQSPIKYWAATSDNSLRHIEDSDGTHPPIEYRLRKPIHRKDVPDALKYLSSKLKQAGSALQMSYRTSVHVHLNCQDLTLQQVYQILVLQGIFESLLSDFCGQEREGNLFCLRGKDAEQWIQTLETGIQTKNFSSVFNDNYRYTFCNTASLGKFGSLEFRAMRGTVEPAVIQEWIDVLLCIKDKALTYSSPKAVIQAFQTTTPVDFFRDVFSPCQSFVERYQYKSDLRNLLWDGMRLYRDVAYAIRWEPRDESLVKKKARDEKPVSELDEGVVQVQPTVGHPVGQPVAETNSFGTADFSARLAPGVYQTWYIDRPGEILVENYNHNLINMNLWGDNYTLYSRMRMRFQEDNHQFLQYVIINGSEHVDDET